MNSEPIQINLVSKKDLNISYYVGPGNGGQKKQKTHSGVLVQHPASGGEGRCSESRHQRENRDKAFHNLSKHPKFRLWLSKRVWEIRNQQTMEQWVETQMNPVNIKMEIRVNGKWVEAKEEDLDKIAG